MCMHVLHVCVCVCILHVHARVHMCMCMCVHANMCVCVWRVCACLCACVHVHVSLYAFIFNVQIRILKSLAITDNNDTCQGANVKEQMWQMTNVKVPKGQHLHEFIAAPRMIVAAS